MSELVVPKEDGKMVSRIQNIVSALGYKSANKEQDWCSRKKRKRKLPRKVPSTYMPIMLFETCKRHYHKDIYARCTKLETHFRNRTIIGWRQFRNTTPNFWKNKLLSRRSERHNETPEPQEISNTRLRCATSPRAFAMNVESNPTPSENCGHCSLELATRGMKQPNTTNP